MPRALATAADPLQPYRAKRDFARTPEPAAKAAKKRAQGAAKRTGAPLKFVIHKHAARSLHYDFRLELDGALLSWAVPKGPSCDPIDKRMAVRTEDHPLAYADFEGTIPEGQYGAGDVIVWDRGRWQPVGDPHAGLAQGKLGFDLAGHKLKGRWELVRMRKSSERQEAWLLIKQRDANARPRAEFDVVTALPDSVLDAPRRPGRAGARPRAAQSARAAARAPTDPAATLAGITVSHPERVIDAQSGSTKFDLVRYYDSVAQAMLPHLKGRAVALLRAPDGVAGTQFFQKHGEKIGIPGIHVLPASLWPGHAALLEIRTRQALLGAAQMNVIEFHTWNSTTRRIDKPDRMVFDLDPGEGVAWPVVREGAALVRTLLAQLGLQCWLKTSGGKGLHLFVPLAPRWDDATVMGFSQALVQHLAQTLPQRFVARSGAARRVGRIFVDYLRNGQGATTVAAFSARARPGLGVSMPLAWDALETLERSDQWTVANARESLSLRRADPWADYATSPQALGAAMKTLGYRPGPGARKAAT